MKNKIYKIIKFIIENIWLISIQLFTVTGTKFLYKNDSFFFIELQNPNFQGRTTGT